jgi:hypothetical protein
MDDRKIHLVWLGSAVPERVTRLRTRLEELHTEVPVRIWRDGDLTWMANHKHLLREPSMAGKADIARFEILLRHGGIYLDCDFSVHRPMDSVFDAINEYGFVTARQSRTLFNLAFMGSQAGHEILHQLVEGIPATTDRFKTLSVVARTGPHYFTEVLMSHVRRGGRFGEIPQHTVYPWQSSEKPLRESDVPPSVIVSHEWATTSVDYWSASGENERKPLRRSWRKLRRTLPSLRGRASRSPFIHSTIEGLERTLFRGGISTRLVTEPSPRDETLRPLRVESGAAQLVSTKTDLAIDAWTSRLAARTLHGSSNFLDLWPHSTRVFGTAIRALDRPGHAILVTTPENRLPRDWIDPSVRCSTHVLTTALPGQDIVERVESYGATLNSREISQLHPSLGFVAEQITENLVSLVSGIPRFALVRLSAEHATLGLCAALDAMMRAQRINRLVVHINPALPDEGIIRAIDLIDSQHANNLKVSLGPWIVDGRGRKWWEHLRIASRPFTILISQSAQESYS